MITSKHLEPDPVSVADVTWETPFLEHHLYAIHKIAQSGQNPDDYVISCQREENGEVTVNLVKKEPAKECSFTVTVDTLLQTR